MSGELPKRQGNQHPNIVPYQVFETCDGHVIVAIGNDDQYRRFCDIIGLPALATESRFATNAKRLVNREVLIGLLATRLRELERDALITGMEANGIAGGPINTLADVFDSNQAAARGMKISMPHPLSNTGYVELIGNPVKFSRTSVTYRYAPPVCGADTGSVLSELGLDRDALSAGSSTQSKRGDRDVGSDFGTA
jgi:crotonobetainyl-CoA:carnitine CoA-transferase CaiB-like acyl-CoA transferase